MCLLQDVVPFFTDGNDIDFLAGELILGKPFGFLDDVRVERAAQSAVRRNGYNQYVANVAFGSVFASGIAFERGGKVLQ